MKISWIIIVVVVVGLFGIVSGIVKNSPITLGLGRIGRFTGDKGVNRFISVVLGVLCLFIAWSLFRKLNPSA
jgi:hypothetical protein